MSSLLGKTTLYSIAHFFVDFISAYYVFSLLGGGESFELLLLYNFCAFALQMPLGIILDRLGRNTYFAATGIILAFFSIILKSSPVLMCIALGLGNALFHIGAGRDVLCLSRGKLSALGIFVSPGALGLFCGTMAATKWIFAEAILFAALFIIVILLFVDVITAFDDSKAKQLSKLHMEKIKPFLSFLFLLCLFVVVIIRSYVGMTLAFPWKSEGNFALYCVLALALGKAAGGILADRFGLRRVTVISLCLAAILFAFYKTPAFGLIAVFLFNMTMPITLGAVVRLLPKSPGFGFGLLTFGLFIGALPLLLGLELSLAMPLGAVIASLVSAILLYWGIRRQTDG